MAVDAFDFAPTLKGEQLLLRPARDEDVDALARAAADPLIWADHPHHDRWRDPVFRSWLAGKRAAGGVLVVIDRKSGAVIGMSRYSRDGARPGDIEIGSTSLARPYGGGAYNGEMKRLMLDHAFRFAERATFLIGEDNTARVARSRSWVRN